MVSCTLQLATLATASSCASACAALLETTLKQSRSFQNDGCTCSRVYSASFDTIHNFIISTAVLCALSAGAPHGLEHRRGPGYFPTRGRLKQERLRTTRSPSRKKCVRRCSTGAPPALVRPIAACAHAYAGITACTHGKETRMQGRLAMEVGLAVKVWCTQQAQRACEECCMSCKRMYRRHTG